MALDYQIAEKQLLLLSKIHPSDAFTDALLKLAQRQIVGSWLFDKWEAINVGTKN